MRRSAAHTKKKQTTTDNLSNSLKIFGSYRGFCDPCFLLFPEKSESWQRAILGINHNFSKRPPHSKVAHREIARLLVCRDEEDEGHPVRYQRPQISKCQSARRCQSRYNFHSTILCIQVGCNRYGPVRKDKYLLKGWCVRQNKATWLRPFFVNFEKKEDN